MERVVVIGHDFGIDGLPDVTFDFTVIRRGQTCGSYENPLRIAPTFNRSSNPNIPFALGHCRGPNGFLTFNYAIEEAQKKGREEGREEGFIEGKRSSALKMIEEGIPLDTVSRITGLSAEELQRLRNAESG